jgi:hypothetical protein
MCKKEEESIDHLLLHCESAEVLWNTFFSRFGLAWWSGGRPRSAVI